MVIKVVQGYNSQNTNMVASKNKIKIAWSIDFDAVSGWLGTGAHPNNSTAGQSAALLAV